LTQSTQGWKTSAPLPILKPFLKRSVKFAAFLASLRLSIYLVRASGVPHPQWQARKHAKLDFGRFPAVACWPTRAGVPLGPAPAPACLSALRQLQQKPAEGGERRGKTWCGIQLASLLRENMSLGAVEGHCPPFKAGHCVHRRNAWAKLRPLISIFRTQLTVHAFSNAFFS
jgi:hypothetical protein